MSATLHRRLSKYGDVQMCKAGEVFTLLITGQKLGRVKTNLDIVDELGAINTVYPVIECMKTDDTVFLLVLKRNP